MSNLRGALLAFVLVTLISVVAAVFRVATASERIRDRQHLARTVCIHGGGEWTAAETAQTCRRSDALLLP